MPQTKGSHTNLNRRSPREAHSIGMSALAIECEAVNRPIRWHAVRDIVCRHLQIAVSTSRDIKRIIKSGQCAEIVEKVAKCAREHQSPRNYRVMGGIILIVRELSLDTILAAEIYTQNLDDLVFRHLDPDTAVQDLVSPAVQTLVQLLETSPSEDVAQRLAVKGTGLAVRVLSKHNEDPETDFLLVALVQSCVSRLCSQRCFPKHTLTAKEIRSLELFRAARTLVDLMENRVMGRPLDWDVLRLTTDCLTWIAFYQREAILQLPCFTGIRMFVTFMLSPSLVTRCRGLLGLLNVHCVNYEGEIRLCDPHLCMRMRGLPPIETHIQNTCDAYMKDHKETLQRRVEQEREERLTNPEPELSTFDAYEAGLRMVEYELNGPETEANSFAYPTERIFGTSSPTTDMFTAMERALRLNQKEYEADVVRLATMVLSLRQSKSNGAKSEQIRRVYFSERLAAANGVKKWPNSSYFYYALIRYRYGSRHLESGLRGVQCTDCTPYLAGQICYQMALNKFTMAVTHLSIYDHRSEWWETGVQYLVQLPASISEASKQIRASSGEAKVLQLLAAAMALLTQNQKADFGKLDSSIVEAVEVLTAKKSEEFEELRAAMSEVERYRKIFARTSAPLIDAMKTMPEIATERQRIAQALKREEVLKDAELEKSMADDAEYYLFDDGQPILPQCSWCHRSSMGLKKCSRCEKVKYCGPKCQQKHWSNGHKLECISPEI